MKLGLYLITGGTGDTKKKQQKKFFFLVDLKLNDLISHGIWTGLLVS